MLKKKIFYKIWNYVLIASFILTGLTGLIMIIIVNYGIGSSWNLTIDFWHAEFAIIMAVSTIIHFHLYWKPLKKVFTRLKKNISLFTGVHGLFKIDYNICKVFYTLGIITLSVFIFTLNNIKEGRRLKERYENGKSGSGVQRWTGHLSMHKIT
jgi:hypothetical protein